MNGQNVRKGPAEILCITMAGLLLAFFAGEMSLYSTEEPPVRIALQSAGFAALVLVFIRLLRPGKGKTREKISVFFRNDRRNLLILAAAAILPRILWLVSVPPQIISDYGLYVRLAGEYAVTGTIGRDVYLLAVAPGAPAFAAVLGLVMRIFGTGAGTAVGFCLVLNLLNIFLVYAIGRKLMPAPGAFAAAGVFALLPENVFSSTLPGTEPAALFLLLAGILTLLGARHREGAAALLFCAGGGLLLALSAWIRASAWAAILAAAVMLLGDSRRTFSRRLLRLAALVLAASSVLAGQQAFRNRIFNGEKPASGLGWTLYEGLDLENGGKWTEEKSKHCIEVITAYPPEEADRIFLAEGLERYRGYTLGEKALLFLRKGGALWYESRYSLISVEGSPTFPRLLDMTVFAWSACLALLAACLLRRLREPVRKDLRAGAVFCLTILLATSLWHEAGTSIGRYHYMVIPFVLLLAAQLLPDMPERAGKDQEP